MKSLSDIKNLDLLRAVAVSCVFFSHLISSATAFNPGSLGRFGVVIFFVHTSFVLMASLERLEKSAPTADWRLTAGFYIRRLFRIYPLAVFIVLLTVVCSQPPGPLDAYQPLGVKAILSNLALTQNLTYSPLAISPLWSLPIEVQMYLVLPFAYFVIRRSKYRSVVLWVLALALATTLPRVSSRLSVFAFAPCFTSGILAYDLKRTTDAKMPAWLFPVALLAIIVAFGPLDNVDLSLAGKLPLAWALSLPLALAIVYIRDGALVFFQPVAHWIAEQSYGIYLIHTTVFWVGLTLLRGHNGWLIASVITAGSIGLPVLLYRMIEKPLIAVGSRLANRVLPRQVPAPSVSSAPSAAQ